MIDECFIVLTDKLGAIRRQYSIHTFYCVHEDIDSSHFAHFPHQMAPYRLARPGRIHRHVDSYLSICARLSMRSAGSVGLYYKDLQ